MANSSKSRHEKTGTRGFTLTELLITMVLATVVAMGAFHIHATFQASLHRQDRITHIQSTMRITRQRLERLIRPAGAGTAAVIHSSCGGSHLVGPFMFHNSNTLNQPDTTAGNADNDPDWFEVMSVGTNDIALLTKEGIVMAAEKHVDDPTKFAVGDLIGIKNENGMCIFMVTHFSAPGHGQPGHINTAQGQGPDLARCYNDPQLRKDCETNVLKNHKVPAGSPVVNLSKGSVAIRIDNSRPAVPLLMMASGTAGGDPLLYDWQPAAMNVEDMQIAVHLDTSDPPDLFGDVWVNDRDLVQAELDRVRAVRISIVFRTATQVPGYTTGRRPALEDRPAATTTDGYIRRVLTTLIKLRNMPEAPPP